MSLLLKAFALKFLAGRTIGGVFALLLTLLVPIVGVLKFIGLPLLLILGIAGAPVFLLLGAIGLPMLLVVGIGGMLLLTVGALLAVGLIALKIALPILLVVWLVRWIWRRRPSRPGPTTPSAEPGASGI
jgi:hypothetical protein